uniref:Transmembrane protein 208 n=1 Tax=Panagrolaimus sp. JU765 TaxID=591449 RepID=A0AC34QRY9_9BILA
MDIPQTKGKQATRGQKLIFEENQQTLRYYFAAAFITTSLVGTIYTLWFSGSVGPYFWTAWAFAAIAAFGAVMLMKSMTKAVRNEKNQVVDAGFDLNDPTAALGEYCKDAVILSTIAQFLCLLWSKFIFIIALLPIYAVYKIWVNWLGPWFFAPAPEEEVVDDKKLRKQQRVKYVRR